MSANRKHGGTEARVEVERRGERRVATSFFIALILTVAVFSAFSGHTSLEYAVPNQTSQGTTPVPPLLKAAIVDQASLSPAGGLNDVFVENATSILRHANVTVDYYSGEEVTVDFFKNLPTRGYKLIVLRVHSSVLKLEGKELTTGPVAIFTSESYSLIKHLPEQTTDQLMIASYTPPNSPYYFAITPKFVTQSMKDNFQDTIIIMTGCEGLNNTTMAQAFIEKGAKVYIGWDKAIYFSHTDTATVHLLQCLFEAKQTIEQAVESTMKTIGPDPAENSILSYYPLEAGDQGLASCDC
jgi:hypothetical protein